MNRRKFLSGVSSAATLTVPAAAITATWPDFIRAAFADKPEASEPGDDDKKPAHDDDALDGLAVVSEGFRRAQRAGKPLLVLVIPQDDSAKWRRGRAFGAWLNHGSHEQLWPLALCVVACATMNDLRRLVPTAGLGDPLMVVVETDAVPATITRLDGKLPEIDYSRGVRGVDDWQERQRREEELVDSHIATLARLAAKGLAGNDATLARRAAQAKAGLSPEQLALLTSGSPSPPHELLDRGAAVLAAAPGPKASKVTALAGIARSRLVKQRVPGSHWASSYGCGTHIEGHPDIGRGIMCGMGSVPEKCGRFLYFYTIPNDPRKREGIIL